MNNEQFNELRRGGWFAVLKHYKDKLLTNQIKIDEYNKAIKFWSKVFKGEITGLPNREKDEEDRIQIQKTETLAREEVINKIVKEFGGKPDEIITI